MQLADNELPRTGIADFVRGLAKKRGVQYRPNGLDAWALKVSELSGDTVQPDETLNLLVSLRRAQIISLSQMAQLATLHLRERKQ